MSNTLAIGAATATIRNLLEQGINSLVHNGGQNSVFVTTLPPEKAQAFGQGGDGWVNLLLYHTEVNAAWRNQDMPRQVKSGETGQPPLALNLFYLLTAYEKTDGDPNVTAHQLLGRAMSVLNDHPLLGADEINAALANNDLGNQIERLRITPQPMSLDDVSKLWLIFQSSYRISAAYQVSVVLIDSTRPARTPLPVLTRGPQDQGVTASPGLVPPFPTLTDVSPVAQPPGSQTSALLGNDLVISGHDLDGTNVSVQVANPLLPAPVILPAPSSATATSITVNLPNQPQNFPAGLWAILVSVTRPGENFTRTSNTLSFSIAPQIATAPPINAARNGNQITITLSCSPQVLPTQRVSLLLGGDEVPASTITAATADLSFVAVDDPPGTFAAGAYFTRLRVDGVDSLLIDNTVQPPKFLASQTLNIP
jgi:hypothetical protein